MDLTKKDDKALTELFFDLWHSGLFIVEINIICGMLVQQWLDYEEEQAIDRSGGFTFTWHEKTLAYEDVLKFKTKMGKPDGGNTVG